MLPLWFALAVFVGRNYAHSDDGPTLVGSHDELKAAIANASIPEIDVVANIEFPTTAYELEVPDGRKVKIGSTHHAVLTGGGITRFFTVAGDLTLSGLTLKNGSSHLPTILLATPSMPSTPRVTRKARARDEVYPCPIVVTGLRPSQRVQERGRNVSTVARVDT